MSIIKTYHHIHPEQHQRAFDIKRMEDIYDKTKGEPDEPHRHDYYIVLLVKDAKGQHIVDFNRFDLGPFQLWFISPGQAHQIIEESKSYGFAITFSLQFMLENGIERHFIDDLYLFNDYGFSPPLQLSEESYVQFEEFAQHIEREISSDNKYKYQACGSWLKLMLIQAYSHCSLSRESNTQRQQASETLLRNFKNLLEEHHSEWHKVKEYAEALSITSDYLNTSIKGLTGKNVKEHIQTRITVAAKRYLLFTSMSNKEIAYALGFSEPANFSQFFKKCTGQSPSQFKQSH